jgi:hypothetical protein
MPIRTLIYVVAALFVVSCGESNNSHTENVELLSYKAVCPGWISSSSLCNVQVKNGTNINYYNDIEGFEFVWGHRYNILVNVSEIKNPPADASSLKYEMIEIISENEDSIGTQYQYDLVELLEHTFTKTDDTFYFLFQEFECADNVDCDTLVNINNSGGLVNVVFDYLGNGKIALVYWD